MITTLERPTLEKITGLVAAVHEEEKQAAGFLNLVANEATMSNVARRLQNSALGERYFNGAGAKDGFVDFEVFTCLGLPAAQELITMAEVATQDMLLAELVNLRPLSGIHAMTCVLTGVSEPGECILTLSAADGGHFATKSVIESLGRRHAFIPMSTDTAEVDLEKLREAVVMENAKVVYLDIMYSLAPPSVSAMRKALPADVVIVFDASHLIGLMLGKVIPSPLAQGADIICANTHKTLPGPHKGLIAYRKKHLGEAVNSRIKCLYSTTHTHHLLSLSVTLLEMFYFGKEYAKAVVENANALGQSLNNLGYGVRCLASGRFTNTHQVHVDLAKGQDYIEMCGRLMRNKIIATFTDAFGPKIFIRFGSQDATRRGMSAEDMAAVGELVHRALSGESVGTEVSDLIGMNQPLSFSFDTMPSFERLA
jgi:glycine/serine hydroxymethyltransferase